MAIRDALAALGVDDLLLGLPDRCLPSDEDEDTGTGALETRGGRRMLAWVRRLGFTGIQLGPQGETDAGNASPYDGTIFSRGRLGLAVARLAEPAWAELLSATEVAALVAGSPLGPRDRIRYAWAHEAHGRALAHAYEAFARRRDDGDSSVAALAARLDAFVAASAPWLDDDAAFEARTHPADVAAAARWRFAQFVLHAQHDEAWRHARTLGLELWGDLQIGLAARDLWAARELFLADYRLGAPPSRTNPLGQAWGYPVFDPRHPGVARFVERRVQKAFAEYDGLRIDHPHGLVCPWVYDAHAPGDVAVQTGARLHAAPDLPDHPALAAFAITRREQLNPALSTPRHADDWVLTLDPGQVDRYARLLDVVVAAAAAHGRERALACEILSTCPYPLGRVLARHGLGRFRVTQKADLRNAADVYRSEHAAPADWIMVGSHDTPPLWSLVETWRRTGALGERAEYLARRLEPRAAARPAFAARLASEPARLAHACFADLFASRARHVSVFFADAFGLTESYNRPGVVHEDNWTLRLRTDEPARYARRLAEGRALDLPLALAMALHARGLDAGDGAALVRRLEDESRARAEGPRTA